jgi:hypothetical protein
MVDDLADHPPHKIEFIFFNILKKPIHTYYTA